VLCAFTGCSWHAHPECQKNLDQNHYKCTKTVNGVEVPITKQEQHENTVKKDEYLRKYIEEVKGGIYMPIYSCQVLKKMAEDYPDHNYAKFKKVLMKAIDETAILSARAALRGGKHSRLVHAGSSYHNFFFVRPHRCHPLLCGGTTWRDNPLRRFHQHVPLCRFSTFLPFQLSTFLHYCR